MRAILYVVAMANIPTCKCDTAAHAARNRRGGHTSSGSNSRASSLLLEATGCAGRDPQTAGAAGIEDSEKEQGITASRWQIGKIAAKLRVALCVQPRRRGVVERLLIAAGCRREYPRRL